MNSTRATHWSLTIANPSAKTEEEIALARQKGWELKGQKEQGVGGLEHYQLMLKTPQVRFSAVKKAFATAHIEIARNPAALELYVMKLETRVAPLPNSQEKYPSLSKYWDLVFDHVNAQNYLDFTGSKLAWWRDAPAYPNVDPLVVLDAATAALIEDGYVVESIACNPSTRSSFKKYSFSIFQRTICSRQDRQTDSVEIPTFLAEEDIITDEASLGEDICDSSTESSEEEQEDDEGRSVEGTDDSDQEGDLEGE